MGTSCVILYAATAISLLFSTTIIVFFVQFLKLKKRATVQHEALVSRVNGLEDLMTKEFKNILDAIKKLIK